MRKHITLIIGLLLVGFSLWLMLTPTKIIRLALEQMDNIGYDLQLRTYVFTNHVTPTAPVAIIDIDDKSLKAEGRWPWSRNKMAMLIDELQHQGVAVIAFDILFAENENNIAESLIHELGIKKLLTPSLAELLKKNSFLFDNDVIFAKSLAQNTAVLALGFSPRVQTENALPPPLIKLSPENRSQLELITANGYISNIPILQQAAKGSGFINIFPDGDGVIRRAPLLMEYNGAVYPGLSLQAVLSFLNVDAELITPTYDRTQKLEGIKIGSVIIPTDSTGQVIIPFIGKTYTFPYYSATDVLHHHVPADVLAGKIVFLGTSATGLGDLKPTAIQNSFPGVEIQATLASGLLLNNFSAKPAWTFGANIVLTLVFGILSAILFPTFGPRILAVIVIFLPPGLILLNNWFWEETGIIISLFMPVILVFAIAIMNAIYGYLFETRVRVHLKEMFGQYVPEKHIDQMLNSTGDYGLEGEDREMSVLFADIRDFTSISEGMPATELVRMLNIYFTPMTEIIFKHQGTIDKYVGDLVMAFWGAPLEDKNHAKNAIQSALEMQSKLKELRSYFLENKWPEIKVGIGINSGSMSVGDMGSIYRRNYTVMGDAVNLSSRVEGLSKYYGVDIVVTESTMKNQTDYVFRKLDRVRVKGKTKGVEIFELVCAASNLTDALKNELDTYNVALDAYFAQKWDEAYTHMSQLAKQYPNSKLYHLYIERIKEFKNHPLPSDWDGIYEHKTK